MIIDYLRCNRDWYLYNDWTLKYPFLVLFSLYIYIITHNMMSHDECYILIDFRDDWLLIIDYLSKVSNTGNAGNLQSGKA